MKPGWFVDHLPVLCTNSSLFVSILGEIQDLSISDTSGTRDSCGGCTRDSCGGSGLSSASREPPFPPADFARGSKPTPDSPKRLTFFLPPVLSLGGLEGAESSLACLLLPLLSTEGEACLVANLGTQPSSVAAAAGVATRLLGAFECGLDTFRLEEPFAGSTGSDLAGAGGSFWSSMGSLSGESSVRFVLQNLTSSSGDSDSPLTRSAGGTRLFCGG